MPPRSRNRELLFLISDVGRLLRTYADQKARLHGMTRAQWAVLLRLERREGLKQSELAEALDLQPITLTRLVDRLCAHGLIERRADPNDRRAKQLYLTPAARPLIDRVAERVEELSATVLDGIAPTEAELMLSKLGLARENLKGAIERNATQDRSTAPDRNATQARKTTERVKRYG
jgi:MarR family transcriptional regulator, transcriptional regulator for hemolysin